MRDRGEFFVLILKSLSLFVRSLPILIYYLQNNFSSLGEYSIISSLSVVVSSVIGLELHMNVNRDLTRMALKKTSHPLKNHLLLIIYSSITIMTGLVILEEYNFINYICLVISFYLFGEHVRYLNFKGLIVNSAFLNLFRDTLFILPFLIVNISSELFEYFCYLYLFTAIVYTFISTKSMKINLSDWVFLIAKNWYVTRVYLINILSRNLLAYMDRFYVLSTGGSEALGRYAIISYIHTSLTTLISGSVVYVKIPKLLNNTITKETFLTSIIKKSSILIVTVWLVVYFIFNYFNLEDVEINLLMVVLFICLGIVSILYGSSGQILYAQNKDKRYVITSIIFTILISFVALMSSTKEIYLSGAIITTTVISFVRLFNRKR